MAAITENPNRNLRGTSLGDAADSQQTAVAVRDMFTAIAGRYDFLNHLLSLNVDRYWWWRAAKTFEHILNGRQARVLDLCCGTGDMAFSLYRRARGTSALMLGIDFSHAMLRRARDKRNFSRLRFIEADALRLPSSDAQFDLVTSAFGFRNLVDYDAGLREIHRVLRRDGEVGILDFGEPKGWFGQLYRFYFRNVLPRIGTLISGVKGPYSYLPASVSRFPAPEQMLQRMHAAGFRELSWTPYTFGIAGLYRGVKP